MDALKILGSLLGNNAMSSGIGGQVFGQVLNGLTRGGAQQPGGGGLGDLLGGLLGGGPQQQPPGGGGLGDLLGGLLGGQRPPPPGAGGGLGSVLGSMLGGGQSGGLGGLGSVLGHLAGGGRSQGGGIPWSVLAGLAMSGFSMLGKGGAGQSSALTDASILPPGAETAPAEAVAHLNQQAITLIKAMLNAAKADGQIDAQEQQNIVSKLADLGPQEAAFIKDEIARPLNMDFLEQVHQGMASNVYMMSLMAINLDTNAEVQYMQRLAQSLGLDPQTVNGLHQQLGITPLYS